MAVILWGFYVAMGTLLSAAFSLNGYAIGIPLFIGINLAAAIYLNKARKHGRSDIYDDRLTTERMSQALEAHILRFKGGEKKV